MSLFMLICTGTMSFIPLLERDLLPTGFSLSSQMGSPKIPESDHMFKVDSFEALDKISNALEKSIIAIEGMGTFRFVSTCNYSYNQRKKQLYLMSHYGLLL